MKLSSMELHILGPRKLDCVGESCGLWSETLGLEETWQSSSESGQDLWGCQEGTAVWNHGQMLKLGPVLSNQVEKDGEKLSGEPSDLQFSSIRVTPHLTILYVRVPNKVPKWSSTAKNIIRKALRYSKPFSCNDGILPIKAQRSEVTQD